MQQHENYWLEPHGSKHEVKGLRPLVIALLWIRKLAIKVWHL